jgi:hypothetical protein
MCAYVCMWWCDGGRKGLRLNQMDGGKSQKNQVSPLTPPDPPWIPAI